MSRWLRLPALLIGALIVAALFGVSPAGASSTPDAAGATAYDHQSPSHVWSGGYTCADDARDISTTYVTSYSESKAHMGSVQLRYSPKCNTYWAQVFDGVGVTSEWAHYWFSAAIVGGDLSDIYCQFAEPDGFTGGGCYTAMMDKVNGRKYQAKGIMFHQTNSTIVAFGETSFVDGTGSNSPVAVATAIQNGQYGSGTTYVYGGGHGSKPGPTTVNGHYGVDCSGFTRWVYALTYGKDVLGAGPARSQPGRLSAVPSGSQRPGDLIFFGGSASTASHVGVYIGNNEMINAPHTGESVQTEPISYDAAHIGFAGYYRYNP